MTATLHLIYLLNVLCNFCSVMVRLNLTWRDRRLNYMNLREDFYQNLVNVEEKQKLWLPTVGQYRLCTNNLAVTFSDHIFFFISVGVIMICSILLPLLKGLLRLVAISCE